MAAPKGLNVPTHTPDLELLYPFYLDTDMSMAFAAALGDGVAIEREEVAHDDLESSALRNLPPRRYRGVSSERGGTSRSRSRP